MNVYVFLCLKKLFGYASWMLRGCSWATFPKKTTEKEKINFCVLVGTTSVCKNISIELVIVINK